MFERLIIFFSIVFIGISSAFAQTQSEYLELSNMNKEFQITSLMNSAIANDAKAAEIFIASGASVNQKNIAGATPLHLAARNNSYETAEILLNNGANVNEKDIDGWTPLMRASLAGNPKMMALLIKYGANLWDQNTHGETPLLHSAMADCYECGKLILDNTNKKDYLTNTQMGRSLQIVNKRYNEPFINLLKDKMNSGTVLTLNTKNEIDSAKTVQQAKTINDNADSGDITQIVYIFTGRKISKSEMEKIGQNNYRQLNQQPNGTNSKVNNEEDDIYVLPAKKEPSKIEQTTKNKSINTRTKLSTGINGGTVNNSKTTKQENKNKVFNFTGKIQSVETPTEPKAATTKASTQPVKNSIIEDSEEASSNNKAIIPVSTAKETNKNISTEPKITKSNKSKYVLTKENNTPTDTKKQVFQFQSQTNNNKNVKKTYNFKIRKKPDIEEIEKKNEKKLQTNNSTTQSNKSYNTSAIKSNSSNNKEFNFTGEKKSQNNVIIEDSEEPVKKSRGWFFN